MDSTTEAGSNFGAWPVDSSMIWYASRLGSRGRTFFDRSGVLLYCGQTRAIESSATNSLIVQTDPLPHKPIPQLIAELNRQLKGWGNYFQFGYPRDAFRAINWHVGQRLFRHLNRRSQRAFRLPEGTTYYPHFRRLGRKPLEI